MRTVKEFEERVSKVRSIMDDAMDLAEQIQNQLDT